ncbi:MAG: EAL domain-containing protein [Clostridiaceae bacterium]
MKVRGKIITYIIGISIVTLISIFFYADNFFSENYSQIENKEIIDSVKVTKGLMYKNEEMLNNSNSDWAAWDDTYYFIQDLNKEFADKNTYLGTFKSLKTNFMFFLDENGKIKYSKGFDINEDIPLAVPKDLTEYIENTKEINTHPDIESKISGFVKIDDNILVISSMPIIKSSYEGPIKGTIILARYISNNEINDINKVLTSKLKLVSINQKSFEDLKDFKFYSSDGEEVYINKVDKEKLLVNSVINDISGNPAFVILLDYPRDIYMMSLKQEYMFLFMITVIILFSICVIIILLERYVFRTISQQESLLNTIPAMVFYKDKNLKYIIANKLFCEYIKIDPKAIKGKSDIQLKNEIFESKTVELDKAVKNNLKPVLDFEVSYVDEDGKTQWFSISKAPVFDAHDRFNGIVGIIFNVTNIKEISERLNIASYYDNTTMLPNKKMFINTFSKFVDKSKKEKSPFAVLYIGIDNFRLINEAIGHQAGDELLRVVAHRITKTIKPEDFISTINGDEFAVVFNENEDMNINDYCKNILNATRKVWKYKDKQYYITICIGGAIYPYDGDSCEEILKNSYTAMQLAKAKGKNIYMLYSKEFSENFMEKLELESNLRLALRRGEFVLYYQTQLDIKTMEIIGVEALIRWIHPEKGVISPGIFIPLAEESGLILQIGEWVINEVCNQMRKWVDKGIKNIKISFNVSVKQFQQDEFEDILKGAIERNKIEPSLVEIEITESLFMDNVDSIIKKMYRIKEMGINILIDDFGTGYSSLLYLKKFPIDKVKIDQNFVRDMVGNEDNKAIIKTIIELSRQLGIRTIAEGVETIIQFTDLKRLRCDEAQGYLFSIPLPPERIEEILI